MFFVPQNIRFTSTIKSCNPNEFTHQLFNPGNLSFLHKQAVSIHPKWINGFHSQLKTSVDVGENVSIKFGVAATGLNSVHFGIDYLLNDGFGPLQKASNIQFKLDPYEQFTESGVCFYPSSWAQLKFKNHIFTPQIVNGSIDDRKYVSLSSIQMENGLTATWSIKRLRMLWSVFASDFKSFNSSLSVLKKVSPNVAIGAELFASQKDEQPYFSLEPSLAAVYWNERMKIAAIIHLNSRKFELSYFKNLSDHFKIGSILLVDEQSKQADASVIWQYSIGDAIIRGKVSSTGLIGATCGIKWGNFNIANSMVANVMTTNVMTANILLGLRVGVEF